MTCKTCQQDLPDSAYEPHRRVCRACRRVYHREQKRQQYARDPARLLQRNRARRAAYYETRPDHQVCRSCQQDLPIAAFQRGFATCRACRRPRQRQYAQANQYKYRQRAHAYHQRYYQEHRDALRAYARRKYQEHRAFLVAQKQRARVLDPERDRLINKRYRATPKGQEALDRGRQRRRARLQAVAYAPVRRAYIYRRDKGICHICHRKVSLSEMSLDHLVPLADGGPTTPENIKLAHRLCNSRRGAGKLPAQLLLIG